MCSQRATFVKKFVIFVKYGEAQRLAFLLREHNADPKREMQAKYFGPSGSNRVSSKRLLSIFGLMEQVFDLRYQIGCKVINTPSNVNRVEGPNHFSV